MNFIFIVIFIFATAYHKLLRKRYFELCTHFILFHFIFLKKETQTFANYFEWYDFKSHKLFACIWSKICMRNCETLALISKKLQMDKTLQKSVKMKHEFMWNVWKSSCECNATFKTLGHTQIHVQNSSAVYFAFTENLCFEFGCFCCPCVHLTWK